MLYAYGLRLGIDLLLSRQPRHSLRYLVKPVNYWRDLEYRLVYGDADFQRGDRVLDIGSPKLMSVYLAERVGAEVYSTDIHDYFIQEHRVVRDIRSIPEELLHLEVADGRSLSFPNGFFDKVYSISVLEHIQDEGDVECMREIGRVLSAGGRCVITVPFAPSPRVEYGKANFYWAGSSTSGENGWVFYQRRYDEDELFTRLIEPSGLRLKKLAYFGDRVDLGPDRQISDFLPKISGPIQPLLSRLLHAKPAPSWRDLKKPPGALIALEK